VRVLPDGPEVSAYKLTRRDIFPPNTALTNYIFGTTGVFSQRLTPNLGIRYEINLALVQLSNFDPSLANPATGGIPGALVFAGYGPGRQNSES